MTFRPSLFLSSLSVAAVLALSGCGGGGGSSSKSSVGETEKRTLLGSYADAARSTINVALQDAKALQNAIAAFTANPTQTTMNAAKNAWLASRESYGVTEIFRLSNGPIDAEAGWVAEAYGAPEGQINAWPLDENMIDYTVDENGATTSGNIIDAEGTFTPEGDESESVNVATITAEALAALNENGGDANVATGYHAIEFLLWGQDQDYNSFIADTVTNGAMTAGQRPLEDYTSNAHAERRKAYLNAAASLLVEDLSRVASAWETTASTNCQSDATGCYRAALLGTLGGSDASKNIAADTALRDIISGMGLFIKSELANERIAVAVLTPSEEDEHSCFSDNTHRDIALNYQGFKNVLKAGSPSLYSLSDASTRSKIDALITSIDAKVAVVDETAKTRMHFDYQIMSGSDTAQTIKDMKNEMRDLGDLMVEVAGALEINLSTSDVTDSEETQVD